MLTNHNYTLSLQEMIRHANTSTDCLPRGLYLCYLKLKSSVDSIQIMVPRKRPNVLPYVQVRGSPCVTREEWAWFKQQSRDGSRPISEGPSTGFAGDLLSACNRMFNMLGHYDYYVICYLWIESRIIHNDTFDFPLSINWNTFINYINVINNVTSLHYLYTMCTQIKKYYVMVYSISFLNSFNLY